MTLEELIEDSRSSTAADPAWLGSEQQRALMQSFAAERFPGTRVGWIGAGERSFVQTGVISMERVRANQVSDAVETSEQAAIMLQHEILHIAYSDQSNAAEFLLRIEAMKRAGGAWLADLMDVLFNALEDVRISRLGELAHPEHSARLAQLHALSIASREEEYRLRAGENPWTEDPASKAAQLRIALLERIYVGERGSMRHPLVIEIVRSSQGLIDRSIQGSHTDDARDGARELVEIVVPRLRELS